MPRGKNSAPAVRISATATLNLNTTKAMFWVNEALLEATQEVFLFEIVPTAKDLSPILTKATKERYPGENRDSIDGRVTQVKKGVKAIVFTKSGYGGFLELGTKKMGARPYIFPSFEMHIQKLVPLVKENLDSLVGSE